jgi:signal recognition particle subunit SRP54
MFDSLSDKLDLVFKKLRGQGVMTEENIREALREVRLVLLEADVISRLSGILSKPFAVVL